jgi:hypothetical protein
MLGAPSPTMNSTSKEIERRRTLVRTLFNDFWRGEDQKPASFTARLDQAEAHLNERLAANRETWRLDAETRGENLRFRDKDLYRCANSPDRRVRSRH